MSAKHNPSLFLTPIHAGFPSPADDYVDTKLDLNEYLIKHPSATFFLRVEGDSMKNDGIHSGDILVVDRALHPGKDSIVVAFLDGEFTVKRLKKIGGQLYLIPSNRRYKRIKVGEGMEFEVWGVVVYVIHKV